MFATRNKRKIYSVSELNAEIKALLEESYPFVWLSGEISNFRIPASGHFYFSIKDATSHISAVMFRGQQRQLKFEPEDGMSITGMGRISVYEPRGTYQIILEYLEPSGVGALQVAFEQLKNRLADEGLFDDEFKTDIPFIPNKIGIITSRSGAVVHDILQVVRRRFPNIAIQIYPVKVQGDGAVENIIDALELLNDRAECDVGILARGGGSLEDLQAFNSESVARAIFGSKIPIISAVGHETDYTIADFVADLRAPTPSAAAELVVPEKSTLEHRCHELTERLNSVQANTPQLLIRKMKTKLEQNYHNLLKSYLLLNTSKQIKMRELTAKLETLSPVAILSRGYSITRTIPEARVIKDTRAVALNQDVEVMVANGRLFCRVKGKSTDGQENI
ncbi:MAG: exodeoxyribonuclease VII large subunit [Desulfobacterales bacterium]